MVAQLVKDSKKHNRILDIEGKILSNGVRVASVVNDQYVSYAVNVHPDGHSSCYEMQSGNPCRGHQSAGHCYHSDAVKVAPLAYEYDTCDLCGDRIKVGTMICAKCLL
jgi:hypothetical protein